MKKAIVLGIFLFCVCAGQARAGALPMPVSMFASPGLSDQETLDRMDLDRLHDLSSGENTIVAVIDTGIDTTGRMFSNALYENTEEVYPDGLDNDGNGYVDDRFGWNFGDGTNNVEDPHGHGTMVSSLVLTVAPDAKILPIKVSRGDDTYFSSFDAAKAVDYAVNAGADIINISFVTSYMGVSLQQSLVRAMNRGVVLIGAAGNTGGDVQYPAAMTGVIAVGSFGLNNRPAWFSPKGRNLDLLAPGESLEAIGPGGVRSYVSGTSFSTAVVSGAAAILLSMNPHLKPESIKNILVNGTEDILDPGFDEASGHGVFDGRALYAYAVPGVYTLSALWRGNRVSLAIHLPPFDTTAEIFIGCRRKGYIYWLQNTGDFVKDQNIPAPVSFITFTQEARSLDTLLFGPGGVFDAIDTKDAEPGTYEWGVIIRDMKGNRIGPAGINELVLKN